MAEQIVLTLSVNGVTGAIQNVEQLRNTVNVLEEQLEKADFGSEQFNKLQSELRAANAELYKFERQFEALDDPVKGAEKWVKYGEGVAGAFAAAQGAAAIFGVESDNLEKMIVKAQGAVAVAMGARMVAESQLLTQLKKTKAGIIAVTAAEKIRDFVTKAGTTGLKIFRGALVSTGLGAIAVAVGVVVANWDKWKDSILNAVKAFLKFNPATAVAYALFQKFKAPLKAVAENLGLVATEAEKAAQKLVETAGASVDETAKQYQKQIDLAKAKGEETEDIERESLKEQLKIAEDAYNAIGNAGKKYTDEEIKEAKDRYEDLASQLEIFNATQQRIKDEAAEAEKQKERERAAERKKEREAEQAQALQNEKDAALQLLEMRAEQGGFFDFVALQNELYNRDLEAFQGTEEQKAQYEKLRMAERNAAIQEYLKGKLDAINAENEAEQKRQEDQKAIDAQAILDANATALKIAEIRAGLDGEITAAEAIELEKMQYQARLDALNEKEKENKELLEALELDHAARIKAIKDNADQETEDSLNEDFNRRLEYAQESLNATSAMFTGIGNLADAFTKNSKKNEKIQKAIAVAQIAIDTAKGISGAVAAAMTQPFPLNIAAVATGVATVLGNIAAAKKALSGSGAGSVTAPSVSGTSVPNFSAPTISGAEGTAEDAENIFTSAGMPENNGPLRAYVIAGDVSSGLDAEQKVSDLAAL